MEGNFPILVKDNYQKLNITFEHEILNTFSPKRRIGQGCLLSPFLFEGDIRNNYMQINSTKSSEVRIGGSRNTIGQARKMKGIKIGIGE